MFKSMLNIYLLVWAFLSSNACWSGLSNLYTLIEQSVRWYVLTTFNLTLQMLFSSKNFMLLLLELWSMLLGIKIIQHNQWVSCWHHSLACRGLGGTVKSSSLLRTLGNILYIISTHIAKHLCLHGLLDLILQTRLYNL